MSLPSYKLSKGPGGVWLAEGLLPAGRPFKIDCGKVSRDAAEAVTEIKLRGKLASSKGSRDRWAKWHREKASQKKGTSGEAGGGIPASTADPSEGMRRPAQGGDSSASRPSGTTPRPSHAELRAKLLHLGDSQPLDDQAAAGAGDTPAVEPDEVIPPDESRDDDPPMDEEGGELVASIVAKGAVLGMVALANTPLKRRTPPQRGEPHEKGLEYFHDGIEHHVKRLVGKTSTLGPTAKIFVGAAIIVGSVWMTAEPIPESERPKHAPAPAPEAKPAANGAAPAPTNDDDDERALVPAGMPLGTFGKVDN